MAKKKVPSEAQAKRLAWLWGDGRSFAHLPKSDPTADVLAREGWVEKTGDDFTFPSGAVGAMCVISEAGIDALLSFLLKRHHSRVGALPSAAGRLKGD